MKTTCTWMAPRVPAMAQGGEYRLKPGVEELRQEKIALFVLATLMVTFSLIGFSEIVYHYWNLEILGVCGAMPTLFGFLDTLQRVFRSERRRGNERYLVTDGTFSIPSLERIFEYAESRCRPAEFSTLFSL
jgi:hypothetical protein